MKHLFSLFSILAGIGLATLAIAPWFFDWRAGVIVLTATVLVVLRMSELHLLCSEQMTLAESLSLSVIRFEKLAEDSQQNAVNLLAEWKRAMKGWGLTLIWTGILTVAFCVLLNRQKHA